MDIMLMYTYLVEDYLFFIALYYMFCKGRPHPSLRVCLGFLIRKKAHKSKLYIYKYKGRKIN